MVDKPAGLVVHPGAGTAARDAGERAARTTCATSPAWAACCAPASCTASTAAPPACMVVAKDDETHRALARQFAARTVEKEYLALVHGVPRATTGDDRRADRPRSRAPKEDVRARAARARRPAPTTRVVEALDGAALAARPHPHRAHPPDPRAPRLARPSRGRRRDLRRNAHALRPGGRRRKAALLGLARPALHAARLVLRPSRTRASGSPSRAPLPADIAEPCGLRCGLAGRSL